MYLEREFSRLLGEGIFQVIWGENVLGYQGREFSGLPGEGIFPSEDQRWRRGPGAARHSATLLLQIGLKHIILNNQSSDYTVPIVIYSIHCTKNKTESTHKD